jgi:hypothetical protein
MDRLTRTSACLSTRSSQGLEVVLVDFYFFAVYVLDFLYLLIFSLLVMLMAMMPRHMGRRSCRGQQSGSGGQSSRGATRR